MVLVRRFDCHFKALLAQLPLCRLRSGFAGGVKREVRVVRLREIRAGLREMEQHLGIWVWIASQ